ncbi:MAG: hypothetical protein AVDCRST_MAG64-2412, partial [uncultured Phycisphaerae bacterium]
DPPHPWRDPGCRGDAAAVRDAVGGAHAAVPDDGPRVRPRRVRGRRATARVGGDGRRATETGGSATHGDGGAGAV